MSLRVKNVADGRMSKCMDPEGYGVSSGRGAMGGLAHLARSNTYKQLICNSGGDEIPWGNQEDSKTGPTRHQEPITHRVCNIVN